MIRFSDAPRGTCRWCGRPILHDDGPKAGEVNRRRRWHEACVEEYNATDPRELRRRIRRRDRAVCRNCGLDTNRLRREVRGRGRTRKLRQRGFLPRRSLWELDHIVPLVDGGGHELTNLQTLCVPCHRVKSAGEASLRAARPPALAEPSGPTTRSDVATPPRTTAGRSDPHAELERLLARADLLNEQTSAALASLRAPRR